MGRTLSLGIELLKYVNTKTNLSLDIKTLSKTFNVLDIEVVNAINNLKALDDNIVCDDTSLSLKRELDFLDKNFLNHKTSGKGRILLVDSIDSTNTHLMTLKDNVVNGDCLITEIQTKGRGRNDHIWFSAIASSLTLSVGFLFKKVQDTMGLSIVSAITLCHMLRDFGLEAKVKWPNDIYVDGKKISGILIESVPRKKDVLFIIGIGLNIYNGSFKDTLNATALESVLDSKGTSLIAKNGTILNRSLIAAALITKLRSYVARFEKEGMVFFLRQWAKYDYLLGKYIVIADGAITYEGVVLGISKFGYLQIKDSQGHDFEIKAGHILLIKDQDALPDDDF